MLTGVIHIFFNSLLSRSVVYGNCVCEKHRTSRSSIITVRQHFMRQPRIIQETFWKYLSLADFFGINTISRKISFYCFKFAWKCDLTSLDKWVAVFLSLCKSILESYLHVTPRLLLFTSPPIYYSRGAVPVTTVPWTASLNKSALESSSRSYRQPYSHISDENEWHRIFSLASTVRI
jgi:hypothetical protein